MSTNVKPLPASIYMFSRDGDTSMERQQEDKSTRECEREVGRNVGSNGF